MSEPVTRRPRGASVSLKLVTHTPFPALPHSLTAHRNAECVPGCVPVACRPYIPKAILSKSKYPKKHIYR